MGMGLAEGGVYFVQVFELYEKVFSLKQDSRSVNEYFASLKGLD